MKNNILATEHLQKAADHYKQLAAANSGNYLHFRLKAAQCLRHCGDYETALTILQNLILKALKLNVSVGIGECAVEAAISAYQLRLYRRSLLYFTRLGRQ